MQKLSMLVFWQTYICHLYCWYDAKTVNIGALANLCHLYWWYDAKTVNVGVMANLCHLYWWYDAKTVNVGVLANEPQKGLWCYSKMNVTILPMYYKCSGKHSSIWLTVWCLNISYLSDMFSAIHILYKKQLLNVLNAIQHIYYILLVYYYIVLTFSISMLDCVILQKMYLECE